MSKKHFIALADAIREVITRYDQEHPENWNDSPREILEYVTLAIANFCADQNPNFDRNRWLGYIDGDCSANGKKL